MNKKNCRIQNRKVLELTKIKILKLTFYTILKIPFIVNSDKMENLQEKFSESTTHQEFNLEEYFRNVDSIIKEIISRYENDVLTYDILDPKKINYYH